MKQDFIKIRGARVNNLKNIDVDIPKNKLVVVTGVSGSGKSSLAFDTIYAEGRRRYVESLSSYARQFLGIVKKPDVDKIEGISPAISIDQRKGVHNPRSTVGTMTEIYDYLRLLFSRAGKPYCPKCGRLLSKQSLNQIISQILKLPSGIEIIILAPSPNFETKLGLGEPNSILEQIKRTGFARVRIDKVLYRVDEALGQIFNRKKKYKIEVVIDSLVIEKNIYNVRDSKGRKKIQGKQISNRVDKTRLTDSVKTALKMGKGTIIINTLDSRETPRRIASKDLIFSENFSCNKCNILLPKIEPRLFSFNSPYGSCYACRGLGEKLEVDPRLLIPNQNLTIAEGAIQSSIRSVNKKNHSSIFWKEMKALSEKYKFSLHEPVKNLSLEVVGLILYGDGKYKGIISELEKKYHSSDSDWLRHEIGKFMIVRECKVCHGKRLKPEALAVKITGKSIDEVTSMSIVRTRDFFIKLAKEKDIKILTPLIKEIINRLRFLIDVGLDYLTLKRKANSLSGGEEQRVRLANQLGSQLSGILYILDEPSIGLHSRDQQKLIGSLKKLRDLGNTVIVCEHDNQTILAADWILDIGPGSGKHGGKIVFQGTPKQLLKSKTLTGDYLAGRKKVECARPVRAHECARTGRAQNYLTIKGASEHNLKNIDVEIPLGKFVCITGVSGSGKSSLMDYILAKALLKKFYRAKDEPGKHKEILGIENIKKVVLVDQSPIGRTPRSNPATYTGVFSYIRDIFSKTKEAQIRGYDYGHFSFNTKGGRCESCEGQGMEKIEMYFLPDVYVKCQECNGTRYKKEILEIEYSGKNIAEVLEMTIDEALNFFKNVPALFYKLKTLERVGLSYIQLGQPAPSLSGGETQRIKLAAELSKKETGKTLYILDEPTIGLHFDDIKKLISVLCGLKKKGNTLLIIEHNLDMIKNSDWCIDLGPEGGDKGGYIVAEGTPQEIIKVKKSYTGQYLKKIMK